MMTNGPAATIGEILDIDLERPRNRLELADNPDYNHLRAEAAAKSKAEKERREADLAAQNSALKSKLASATSVTDNLLQ